MTIRRPQDPRRWPRAARALTAVALLGALAATGAAQAGVTQWSFEAEFHDYDGLVDSVSDSGLGNGFYSEEREYTGLFGFSSTAEVVPGTANLKASVDVQLSGNQLDGMRVIGQSAATHSDVFTVTAGPGFEGGQLRFVWGLEGRMYGLLIGEQADLFALYWDWYQSAELFAYGPAVARTTVSKGSLEYSSVALPDTAKNFTSFIPWDLNVNESVNVAGQDRLIFQQDFEAVVGAANLDVAVAPGLPVALDFRLHTGVNVLMFNEDAHQALSFNNGMEFAQTATLAGVQLLDASGRPYLGEWSLSAASGIDYTILPVVPEPSAAVLALVGLVGLVPALRRRRRGATGA